MTAQARRHASAGDWLGAPELSYLVRRIAARYGVAPADVQDLVQEARIALWRLGPDVSVGTAWLVRTTIHKIVDHLRSRVRARTREQAFAQRTLSRSQDPHLEHLLHVHTAALPSRLRDFYQLSYVQGMSEREVARQLGVCRASVRWLDRCCRRALLALPLDGQPKGPAVRRRR